MLWNREITRRLVILGQIAIAGCVACCLAMGWWCSIFEPADSPVRHFSSRQSPPPTSSCADCHQDQVDSLKFAPHSLTLQSGASDNVLITFGGLQYRDPKTDKVSDVFEVDQRRLWRRNAVFGEPVPIDWVLGSGRHARTPVSMRESADGKTELIEHRLSWYPGVGLDLTLGATGESTSNAGWHGLGKRLNPVDTGDCLGCHSTWLPTKAGHLDLPQLVPGVQCARCHLQGEAHLQAVNAGDSQSRMERWSELSPLDSIRRCGECHRRDDHLTHLEVRPDNPTLIRFAPVGLSQSRCFVFQDKVTVNQQKQRLDCLTCHNPHRPAETQPEYYVARCLQCHGSNPGQADSCTAKNTSQQCLDCHMPKVEVQTHLRFTDHWIRLR